jgi:hypothetical protein
VSFFIGRRPSELGQVIPMNFMQKLHWKAGNSSHLDDVLRFQAYVERKFGTFSIKYSVSPKIGSL